MHTAICQTLHRQLQSALYRRWSLNWNTITPEIIVGSCPRSPSDIDRMVDEANISAIICLQACLQLSVPSLPSVSCNSALF